MIDASELHLNFRGYPVSVVSDRVAEILSTSSHGAATELHWVLYRAKDVAQPGEPSGWHFESELDGETVWIERFGGVRSEDRHEGGQWSVYLPSER